MLKKIPSILSPDLLKTLMEMGHGDELVLADGNFFVGGHAERVVRADGLGIPPLLDAILQFFPLDPYVENPVILMQVTPGDPVETPIWDEYRRIVEKHEPRHGGIENVERFAFYERARRAHTTVTTGEKALYANIILKKGVVVEE
ncbi:MAG: fucose isomerase [Spirochaetaceae bacterium]|nr:MAG: fucose isomerase [Spirochaetaceae bacterium]